MIKFTSISSITYYCSSYSIKDNNNNAQLIIFKQYLTTIIIEYNTNLNEDLKKKDFLITFYEKISTNQILNKKNPIFKLDLPIIAPKKGLFFFEKLLNSVENNNKLTLVKNTKQVNQIFSVDDEKIIRKYITNVNKYLFDVLEISVTNNNYQYLNSLYETSLPNNQKIIFECLKEFFHFKIASIKNDYKKILGPNIIPESQTLQQQNILNLYEPKYTNDKFYPENKANTQLPYKFNNSYSTKIFPNLKTPMSDNKLIDLEKNNQTLNRGVNQLINNNEINTPKNVNKLPYNNDNIATPKNYNNIYTKSYNDNQGFVFTQAQSQILNLGNNLKEEEKQNSTNAEQALNIKPIDLISTHKIKELENTLQENNKEIHNYYNQIVSLKESGKLSMDEKNKKIQDLIAEKDLLNKQNKQIKQSSAEEINILNNELYLYKNRLESLKTEIFNLNHNQELSNSQKTISNSKILKLEKEILISQDKIETLQDDHRKQKLNISQIKRDNTIENEKLISNYDKKIKNLEEKTLRQKEDMNTEKILGFTMYNETIIELQAKLETYLAEIDRLEMVIKDLASNKQTLDVLQSTKKLTELEDCVSCHSHEYEEDLSPNKDNNIEISLKNIQIGQLNLEINNQEKIIEELTNKNKTYIIEAEKNLKQINDLNENIINLQNENKLKIKELNNNNQKLQGQNQEIEGLKEDLSGFKIANQESNQQIQTLNAEIDNLQNQIKELTISNQKLQGQNHNSLKISDQKIDNLQNQIKELTISNQLKIIELQNENQQSIIKNHQIIDQNREIEGLKKDLSNFEIANQKTKILNTEIKNLQNQINELENNNKQLILKNKKIKLKNTSNQKLNKTLQENKDTLLAKKNI